LTQSSHRWRVRPGGFDTVHATEQFPTDGNPYDIPTVRRAPFSHAPDWLVPYRTRVKDPHNGGIHFFLDDYRFESVWGHPTKALRALLSCNMVVLTPDFSLFPDWPIAIQIWNTYRNRWTGAKWQSEGLRVIPTLSWSTPQSYAFAFAGVETRSLVAISTLGLRRNNWNLFEPGYRAMIQQLQPSQILCYGRLKPELERLANVQFYQTRWDTTRRRALSVRSKS
jgi:hypothetical protein